MNTKNFEQSLNLNNQTRRMKLKVRAYKTFAVGQGGRQGGSVPLLGNAPRVGVAIDTTLTSRSHLQAL